MQGPLVKGGPTPNNRYSGVIKIAGVVIVVLGLFCSAVKVIELGMVGVRSLFGKVESNVLESGLHVIDPLAEVTTFDSRTQNYTMSGQNAEGQKMW